MRHRLTRAGLLACGIAMSGCYLIDRNGDISSTIEPWTGTIERAGVAVQFVGYDPIPTTVGLAAPSAAGWIHPIGESPAFTYLELTFEGLPMLQADQARTVQVQQQFLRGQSGVALSYIESGEPGFRMVYLEGDGEVVSGILEIEDTDWTTRLTGHLAATVTLRSGDVRRFDIDVRWSGSRD